MQRNCIAYVMIIYTGSDACCRQYYVPCMEACAQSLSTSSGWHAASLSSELSSCQCSIVACPQQRPMLIWLWAGQPTGNCCSLNRCQTHDEAQALRLPALAPSLGWVALFVSCDRFVYVWCMVRCALHGSTDAEV